ncbi:MAG: DUF4835 domain-containing protein [Bacteroidetes bacterium MedPE-SWsnd-G2]|nr:MAG: DUF4835 domain-containing protein [Bacteroidetes bacterium MedPE-SWsnd-G2]
MRNILPLFLVFFCLYSNAQELSCDVVVNAELTGNENVQVFRTLERQLKEFINNTQWTNSSYEPQERINCSFIITIEDYNNDAFKASLQVQSTRPVYGSMYSTPIYNYNDSDFNFEYLEFQNLNFNDSQYESNLVSVIAFHVYMVLGLDGDSFALNGGEKHLRQAQTILNYSQQGNYKGWKLSDGLQTRFALIDNMLSQTYKEFRTVMYEYHRIGLDQMSADPKKAKQSLAAILVGFESMNKRRPNSFLMRVFFDAKSEEVEDIFSGGPQVNISSVVSTLNNIAPMHSAKWRNISF